MNTYYYISKERKQEGPINIEDFEKLGLGKNTLVWRKGMTQWAPLSDIEEFASISNTPPPIPYYYEAKEFADYIPLIIFASFLFFMPAGIIAFIYAIKANAYKKALRYNDAVKANSKAQDWTVLSFLIGLCIYVFIIIILFAD